jgi:L,D-peptidoglycan transpeptidase YkuD (ErfK/YbiS/YcfS/YnhG family)
MGKPPSHRHVLLQTLSRRSTTGTLVVGNLRLACAIGRSGLRAMKREGDGATPAGVFRLREAYYRADRIRRPRTVLPLKRTARCDGWCDAPGDRNYNRPVRHPYAASAERMWREDGLYDVVVVLDHNRRPRAHGLGSAIFMHVARAGYRPTEGCVALARRDLLLVLETIGRCARLFTDTASRARLGSS